MLPVNRPFAPAEFLTPDSNGKIAWQGKTDRKPYYLMGNYTLNSVNTLGVCPRIKFQLDHESIVTVKAQTKADHADVQTDHSGFQHRQA